MGGIVSWRYDADSTRGASGWQLKVAWQTCLARDRGLRYTSMAMLMVNGVDTADSGDVSISWEAVGLNAVELNFLS